MRVQRLLPFADDGSQRETQATVDSQGIPPSLSSAASPVLQLGTVERTSGNQETSPTGPLPSLPDQPQTPVPSPSPTPRPEPAFEEDEDTDGDGIDTTDGIDTPTPTNNGGDDSDDSGASS